MNLLRILFFAGCTIAVPLLPATAAEPHSAAPALSQEQQLLSDGIAHLLGLLEPSEPRRTAQTTLAVVKSTGLPKYLAGATLDLAVSPPDRIRIATSIDNSRFALGRNGAEAWIWAEQKQFGVVGKRGIPRFASRPASIDETELAPLTLPLPREQVALLPLLCEVKELEKASIDGEACRVLRALALPAARKTFAALSGAAITIWLRTSDRLPVQIGFTDGRGSDLLIALRHLQTDAQCPEEFWNIPATPDAKVEQVALSHLANFAEAAASALNTSVKPLGPATGKRTILASYGHGRLEDHDGTKVLFLAGTPEEMGAQHGHLLKREVGDLVSRVLYGVGVGSSFAQGRWFFGEIEACTARIQPFIDPRYLREMDALAHASGHEAEEIRLANFFPELFHCSGFALMGSATAGGRIFHGRILDYMKGIGLEKNATVIVAQPDEGYAWVNVGYAGLVGTVTAMNEKQISIGEMGGRGEGNWDGKPMAQLLREVMEHAGTLDEAIEIMRRSPRTCEYYYVVADGKTHRAAGIAATPDKFEVVGPGEAHPQLATPIKDTVLLSAGDRYTELVRRVQDGFGNFNAETARELMTRPVCMTSNIHSVLFAPDTLDFWVANADSKNVASHTRYTHYNLRDLLASPAGLPGTTSFRPASDPANLARQPARIP
jgi:hypothetical protein